MVAREGFEPSVEDPKASALPLGHRAASLNSTVQGARERRARVACGRGVALGQVMRNVVLAARVLLTAACGAYSFPGASPAATGIVTGMVTVIPCGPILPVPQGQPQDSVPCKMMVAARVEMDFASGGTVTSPLTDANGRYRRQLPMGRYTARAKG